VMATTGAGFILLPVLNPPEFVPSDFPRVELIVASVEPDAEPIVIRGHDGESSVELYLSGSASRRAKLKSLAPGDKITAWYVPESGFVWQLGASDQILVPIEERLVEKRRDGRLLLGIPGLVLVLSGLFLVFIWRRRPRGGGAAG